MTASGDIPGMTELNRLSLDPLHHIGRTRISLPLTPRKVFVFLDSFYLGPHEQ